MLVPLIRPFRKGRRPAPQRRAPVAALTLVAATYDDGAGDNATLTFDRAVDIAGIDPTAIEVDDAANTGFLLRGVTGGATLDGPNAVRVTLEHVGDATGAGVTLTASAANGIVAAGDGGAWAGVSGRALPFP